MLSNIVTVGRRSLDFFADWRSLRITQDRTPEREMNIKTEICIWFC